MPEALAISSVKNEVQPSPDAVAELNQQQLPGGFHIQCSLTVGAPDDPLEHEADAMADTVMRMPNVSDTFSPNSFIQRKCAHCEEEEKAQRKPLSASITPFIQTKSNGAGTTSASLYSKINNSRGNGSSMDNGTRTFMESRFGSDFSSVKIHTGSESVMMNRELSAKAFTVGNDIYFNEGQYNPQSDSGKHLLAHELTHTIQQGKAPSLQRSPLIGRDAVHDPLLDQFSAETGADRETASQHSSAYETWLMGPHATPPPPPQIAPRMDASCNSSRSAVIRTVNDALTWLDNIYQQLVNFEAEQVFDSPGATPSADHVRIANALQQTFHTTDWLYVQVLASRFYHIGRMLREPGRVTIFCGGAGCTLTGSSIVSAYVDTPYQIHICGTGGNIATFIHEMCHAVIPTVGIRNTVTQGSGLNDRAYDHERVFHHLSPEEALDNAESYGLLADALVNRTTGNIVRPQADTTSNCSTPNHVLSAIARAEFWTRRSWQILQKWTGSLNGQPPSTLQQPDLDLYNNNLSFITSYASLAALYQSMTNIYTNGYASGSGISFNCLASGNAACNNGVLGIAYNGTITSSAVTTGTQSPTGQMDLCADWFTLPETDRIRTMFVLFLLTRPSWMVTGINMANAFSLADFGKASVDASLPAITTTDASQHLFIDSPTAPITPATP